MKQSRLNRTAIARVNTPIRFAIAVLCAVFSLRGLTAEELPNIRPAMIGSGPGSLVNLIDVDGLYRKGQRDAWVMFNCSIAPDGIASRIIGYRVSPNSDLLKSELSKRLKGAGFIPAVYNHRRTWSGVSGTVIFVVANGKPHLRIFENQDLDELKRGSDLIWPQVVDVPNAPPPTDPGEYPGHEANLDHAASVKIRHSTDAEGNTTDVQVVSESSPGHDFGTNAVKIIRGNHYLPAYRNGRPTALTRVFEFRFVAQY
jgi:TonB family protein